MGPASAAGAHIDQQLQPAAEQMGEPEPPARRAAVEVPTHEIWEGLRDVTNEAHGNSLSRRCGKMLLIYNWDISGRSLRAKAVGRVSRHKGVFEAKVGRQEDRGGRRQA